MEAMPQPVIKIDDDEPSKINIIDMPQPVIKIEDDEPSKINIIDVDDYVSTEEKITKWHSKIRDRIKTLLGKECETSLDNLMEWYVGTLNEDIFNIEVNRRFIVLLEKHIQSFYSYFKGLNWISADGYLDNMEQILAFYLDCEGRIFIREKGRQKRNKKMIRKRLLTMFKSYLLNQEDRIHHALMKMRLNLTCDDAKKFLDNVFRVVFSQKPNNQSDAAFCRAFILYQKWKRIQSPEIWSTLDEMLHQMYRREPDSIQTNCFWKEILPTNTSLIEIIAQFGESDTILCEAYFKYLKSLNIEESDVAKINLDNLPQSTFRNPDLCVDNEPSQFSTLMESCAQLAENEGNCVVKTEIEIEDDDDDDCVIVSEDLVEIDPKEIVYEILDDDDAAAADLKLKEPCSRSINNKSLFRRKNEEHVSFLDSIDISENDKDTSSGKNAILIDSVISPLPKLQNLDNDSVKSREILSRKFTRKKEDAEQSMECVVESIKISDDLKSNDRKFDTETSNLHSPHSTFISNSSSPNPTESTERKSKESYASPTSPDISSTCDPNVCPEQEPDEEPMEVPTETASFNDLAEPESIVDNDDRTEAESTIVVTELPIYCFVAESTDDPIDPTLVADEPTGDHSEAELTSDRPVEAELTTEIVADEPTGDHSETELTSDRLVEAELTSDRLVEAELTSDRLVEAELTSDRLVEAEPTTVIVADEPDSDHSEAELTSDRPVEAEPTSDLVEANARMSDIEAEAEFDPEPAIDQIEAESTRMECLSSIGRKIEEEYTPKNTVRSGYGSPDRVESTNNEEECDIWKIKRIEQQVGVTIPRIKVRKVKKRKMDVVYSQKVKSNNEVHHWYDSLKGGHGLDECLVGEVEKLDLSKNVTLNGIPDFDLFADHVPPKENQSRSSTPQKNTTASCTTTSPSDLKSPDYDGIDDFKVYYTSNQLQEYINDTTEGSRTAKEINIQEKENILENDQNDQNRNKEHQIEKEKSPKKKKITFAKENTVYIIESNPPLNIPTDQMSEKSLTKYKVEPTHACLQGQLQVAVERCSEMEVKGWRKLSENTRRKRLEESQSSSPQLNPNSMKLFRFDYDKSDKSTPWPSESDIVHYREEDEEILWRTNDQHKFDISEEGRYNGRKVGKRKSQRSGDSDEGGVKKRGRPKKRT